MFARRRRSHGGYMIRVPTSIDITTEVDNKITMLKNFNTEILTQYGLKVESQSMTIVTGNQCQSPVLNIIEALYQDNTLKELYFLGSAIQYISVTSGMNSSVVDKAYIQANTINISYLNDDDYLIDNHLTVDKTSYDSYITYLYPIPVHETGFNVFNLNSQTKVQTYNNNTLVDTAYFTGDLSYNHTVVNGKYFLQIDTLGAITEVFPKYCITYDNVNNTLLKFKNMTISQTATIVTDNLEEVTF